MKMITEGKAKVSVSREEKISKKLEVFYNPVMKFNRDISVLLLNCVKERKLRIGLPLAGSGIRGLRFLLELKRGKVERVAFNDHKPDFVEYMEKNLKKNKIKQDKVHISKLDANLFLLKSKGFDYIDVDPFGTPNPFLDSAVSRISRRGILAVTATDTSALCGTFPEACLRKYWAKPLRNELMHEIGVRILIRKVQLIGAQYERALVPIFCYSRDHYMRVFFKSEKGKQKVNLLLKLHGEHEGAGPMWLGSLWDTKLVRAMLKNAKDKDVKKYLGMVNQEAQIHIVGFFDVHAVCEKNKLNIPRKEYLIGKLKKSGYKASSTTFNPYGIRTNAPLNLFLSFLKEKC
ncbi:MAG: tRNA (guanine(26)-N(2))-dimethyltransferase [archaeon]